MQQHTYREPSMAPFVHPKPDARYALVRRVPETRRRCEVPGCGEPRKSASHWDDYPPDRWSK